MDLPNGDEHVNPDFPIFDRTPEVSHIKFVSQAGPVVDEAARDFISLVFSQEFGCRRVITHNEKSYDCHDDCDDTFDDLEI